MGLFKKKKEEQKVYFDRKYHSAAGLNEGVSELDTEYTVRIEGYIEEESETQYKVRTGNFWNYYGINIIKYPTNRFSESNMNPQVKSHYWIDIKEANLIK